MIAPSAWDHYPSLDGSKALLETGPITETGAQFELEERSYEPNSNVKATFAPQVSILFFPIPPLCDSLKILNKQDPFSAKGCRSISSSCSAFVRLLPSHCHHTKGLSGSQHYQ